MIAGKCSKMELLWTYFPENSVKFFRTAFTKHLKTTASTIKYIYSVFFLSKNWMYSFHVNRQFRYLIYILRKKKHSSKKCFLVIAMCSAWKIGNIGFYLVIDGSFIHWISAKCRPLALLTL